MKRIERHRTRNSSRGTFLAKFKKYDQQACGDVGGVYILWCIPSSPHNNLTNFMGPSKIPCFFSCLTKMLLLMRQWNWSDRILLWWKLGKLFFGGLTNLATFLIWYRPYSKKGNTFLNKYPSIKWACKHLWNPSIRLVFRWAKGRNHCVGIPCAKALTICIHPPVHLMLPPSDCCQLHWGKSMWHIFFESLKGHVTSLLWIPLYCTPEEFNKNKVEFTMELRQHNAEMMCPFNHFLDEWLLVLEVWLALQNSTATTCYCLKITFCLALALNSLSWYVLLCKNMAETFWLVWICRMVSRKYVERQISKTCMWCHHMMHHMILVRSEILASGEWYENTTNTPTNHSQQFSSRVAGRILFSPSR